MFIQQTSDSVFVTFVLFLLLLFYSVLMFFVIFLFQFHEKLLLSEAASEEGKEKLWFNCFFKFSYFLIPSSIENNLIHLFITPSQTGLRGVPLKLLFFINCQTTWTYRAICSLHFHRLWVCHTVNYIIPPHMWVRHTEKCGSATFRIFLSGWSATFLPL